MTSSLDGAVVLVTGGSSGIGAATATALAARGARVVSVARREHDPPPGGHTRVVDLQETGVAPELVHDLVTEYGRLDVVVANAGVMVLDEVLKASSEDWARMIAVNLVGTTELVRAALPALVAAANSGPRGVADVVLVGSTSARVPAAGRSIYAATKAGIRTFADVLRVELAAEPVRVGLIEPGLTATGLRDGVRVDQESRDRDEAAGLARVMPLQPEDVAQVIGSIVDQPREVSIAEVVVLPTTQGR